MYCPPTEGDCRTPATQRASAPDSPKSPADARPSGVKALPCAASCRDWVRASAWRDPSSSGESRCPGIPAPVSGRCNSHPHPPCDACRPETAAPPGADREASGSDPLCPEWSPPPGGRRGSLPPWALPPKSGTSAPFPRRSSPRPGGSCRHRHRWHGSPAGGSRYARYSSFRGQGNCTAWLIPSNTRPCS